MKSHYRIVRFSPAPEFVEPVNVALLIVDEKARIIHDDRFSKLECVSGLADPEMLKFWLQDAGEQLQSSSPERAHLLLSQSNSQVSLSEPRELIGGFSSDIEEMLVSTYLRKIRKSIVGDSHRPHVEGLLDHWLNDDLRIFAKRFIKRASPADFLSPEVKRHLKGNGFRISRVYSGSRGLVLLDGLNLAASEATVSLRAHEIGYAYYTMESVRKILQEKEHKQLLRASVVFNPTLTPTNSKFEYAVANVKHVSDLLITDPASKPQRRDLEQQLIAMSEGELGSLETV